MQIDFQKFCLLCAVSCVQSPCPVLFCPLLSSPVLLVPVGFGRWSRLTIFCFLGAKIRNISSCNVQVAQVVPVIEQITWSLYKYVYVLCIMLYTYMYKYDEWGIVAGRFVAVAQCCTSSRWWAGTTTATTGARCLWMLPVNLAVTPWTGTCHYSYPSLIYSPVPIYIYIYL